VKRKVGFEESKAAKKQRIGPTFKPEEPKPWSEPLQKWCASINQDSNNEDAKAYMSKVLKRSESRAFQQAKDLLIGESSTHPPSNLPSHVSPRELVAEEPPCFPSLEEFTIDQLSCWPQYEDDCRVEVGLDEPGCCIAQGMSILPVF
jgi:hypothetical protein